jgi:hypothetical protein
MNIGIDIDTVFNDGKPSFHFQHFLQLAKENDVHLLTRRPWEQRHRTLAELNKYGFTRYQGIHFIDPEIIDDFKLLEEDGKCRLWSQMTTEFYGKAWVGHELGLDEYYDADPDELYMFMKKETDPDIGINCYVVLPTEIVEFDEDIHLTAEVQ